LLVEDGGEFLELSLINSRVSSRIFAIGMSHFPINHSGPSTYYHTIHVSMRKRNSKQIQPSDISSLYAVIKPTEEKETNARSTLDTHTSYYVSGTKFL